MKRLFFSVAFLLLVVGSCIAQDVRHNFDKNTDFSKFKTYKWVALKDAAKVDDLVDKQIKDTVDAELTKKGLTRLTETTLTSISPIRPRLDKKNSSRHTTPTGVTGEDGIEVGGTVLLEVG